MRNLKDMRLFYIYRKRESTPEEAPTKQGLGEKFTHAPHPWGPVPPQPRRRPWPPGALELNVPLEQKRGDFSALA